MSASDAPSGRVIDNSYESRTGQKDIIPVDKDEAPVVGEVNAEDADSDKQLERDDKEAINQDNVIEERTRGAAKQKGTYTEPGDEEGLPGPEDGTSSTR